MKLFVITLSVFAAVLGGFFPVQSSFAQASLAAEDVINDIVIQYQGKKEAFTVVRDARDRNQWYYVQNAPRITESSDGTDVVPDLSLVRYQKKDNNTQQIYEGGLLQFSATLQLPSEVIDLLKANLTQNHSQNTTIRLTALPIKSATVAMYTPIGNGGTANSKLLTTSDWGNGIAPTFSSQKMAFTVELTNLGTDVLEALVNGNTGIPVAVTYTYNGLTPKAGFKISIDWDQTYSYYSRDEKIRASASYFGWFGASYERNSQQIFSDLQQNKCIKVDIFAGENLTMADVEKYLQPILARINQEILSNFTPPPAIDPAIASSPTNNGSFFSAGYSVAMKDVRSTKHGTEVMDFSVQQVIERKTIAGGFIGIGKYSKNVKDKVVQFATDGPLKTAYILLPNVFSKADAQAMGISDITMECEISGSGRKYSSVSRWRTSDEQWTADGKTKQEFMLIPLGQFLATDNDLSKLNVINRIVINSDNKVIKYEEVVRPNDGGFLIGTINKAGYEILTIDPSDIDYKRLNASAKTTDIQMKIQIGQDMIRKAYKPFRMSDGSYVAPSLDKIIIFRQGNAQNYSINIIQNRDDGSTKSWKYNGVNTGLPAKFQGGLISLEEVDFN
jgi:hypothetical protein